MIDLFTSPSPIHKNHNSNDDNIKCKQQYNRSLFPKKFNFDNSHTTKSIFPISSQEEIRIPNFKQEIKEFQDPQLTSTFSQTHSDKNLLSYGQQKSQVNLNVLIAGSQGIGKSTFVDVFLNKKPIERFFEANDNSSNNFQESLGMLEFENQIVYLNIFDTKGFQKNDLKVWFKNIRHFINSKFKTQVRRNKYAFLNKTVFSQMSNLVNDERIHLCLYFLSGPINIKEDLFLIQKLSNLVNVIPILAKGDQYTKLEVLELKQRYNNLFIQNKIDLFDCLKINDELFKQQLQQGEFGQCSPFMVISSTSQYINENGKIIQGRQYPWGFCDLWNPKHSDFQLLFKALIGYYLFDLIKLTDFYQHSYIKNKKESQKKVKSKINFFNQILLHINQILYLID